LPSFSSSTEIELRRSAGGLPYPDAVAARAAAGALDLVAPGAPRPELGRADLDRQRTRGRTLDQVLATMREFQKIDPRTASKEDRDRFGKDFVALAALLALNPQELSRARGEIEKGSPIAITLIAALRDARTPEAQATLRELLGQPGLDPTLRGLVARDLSHVQDPAPETVALFERLQTDPDVGVQATYGLGSNIHKLEKSNPTLANSTLRGMTSELSTSKSDDRRAVLLTALGNAGQSESLEVIEPQTRADSPQVRTAAAQALRRIPDARADELLIKLIQDPDGSVRYSALDAISERSPTAQLARAIADLAVVDPSVKTRYKATDLAGRWLPRFPELRVALESIAASDGDEHVRRVARVGLDRASPKR
jgi:hypothetical protein